MSEGGEQNSSIGEGRVTVAVAVAAVAAVTRTRYIGGSDFYKA